AAVGADAAVCRDAVEVPVGEPALGQGAEGNKPTTDLAHTVFQAVFLDFTIKQRVAVLADDKGAVQVVQNGGGFFQRGAIVVGKPHIQCLAAALGLGQGFHGFFQQGGGVHAVVVEDIHIVQAHPLQALVQPGQQMLAAAPVPVGAVPHQVPGLGADDQFVPVGAEILPQNAAEVPLRRTGCGAVVIGQIKVGDAVVEGG